MAWLDSLFAGAKAFLKGAVVAVRETVKAVLEEIDNSSFGKAATQLVRGVAERHFNVAKDLADEEHELAEKRRRDGRLTENDLDRLREIEAERGRLRRELDEAKAARSAQELREAQGDVIAAAVTGDEAAASIGILSTKVCPECGGAMRIQLGGFNTKTDRQTFYWQCTSPNPLPCPTLKLDPEAERTSVLRRPDADLDGSRKQREEIWTRPDVLNKAHGRLRASLDEEDEEIVCPAHMLPMKLMPKPSAGGRMLDSYEYICLGITPDGRACGHKVPVKSFPQVSAALRRREGRGIIDG